MKSILSMSIALALLCGLVITLDAQDKGKEVTLKGTITCAKCDLKEAKKCTNAIKVKEGGKDVVYIFDDNGGKEKYHRDICTSPKEGSVKGTVGEKDGKKTIKPAADGVKFE